MYRIIYAHRRTLVSMMILFYCSLSKAQQKVISCFSENDAILTKIDTIGLGADLDCLINIFIEQNNINSKDCDKQESYEKEGREMHYDTLGYSVSKITSPNGQLQLDSYLNSFINLKYVKRYNDGKISQCGFLCNSMKIGVWKYFSLKGEIDSLVNYDEKRSISFCEFFEIAKSFGMIGKLSKLPNREEIILIAEQNDLSIEIPKYSILKVGWPSLLLINQESYENECKFTSSIYYNKKSNTWSVTKSFNDKRKSFCFGIIVNTKRRTVMQFEPNIKR